MGLTYAGWLEELDQRVAGADADSDLRRRFADRYDGPTYDNPREMYRDGVDAVVVTAPTKFHEPAGVGAFEHDLPVLFEKPLAHTVESAERIVETARETDCFGMVGYHYRFLNQYRLLKSFVDQGRLGELTHVHARHVTRRTVPRKGSWMTSEQLAGGGVLMDRGSFVLDLVLHLTDYPDIDRLLAQSRTDFGDRDDYAYLKMWGEESEEQMFDVEDSVVVMLELADGCTVSVEVTWAANVGPMDKHTYDVRGTDAGALLEIDPENPSLSMFEAGKDVRDYLVDSTIHVADNHHRLDQLRVFLNAVADGDRPDRTTLEQGLEVNRLIDRIYEDSS
jgi:predicted dehydrogenase